MTEVSSMIQTSPRDSLSLNSSSISRIFRFKRSAEDLKNVIPKATIMKILLIGSKGKHDVILRSKNQ